MNKLLKPSVVVLCLLLFCTGILSAQEVTVTGTVTAGDTKKPLEGVSVRVKNTTIGVATNANGQFSVKAPSSESIISISFVGYQIYESKAGTGGALSVELIKLNEQLDEVVVIGYGTQKLKNVTGSVVSIDPKKLEDMPVATVTEALRGQVPGLNVSGGSTRPGTMPTMNIRQQFDFSKDGGSAFPLIVIDDVIQVDPSTGKPSMDRFNLLDMSEVESITVLRDGAAAIYGSRAGQGAVIVKTKRGKIGAPKISYSGKFETNDAVSHGKVMNAHDFGVYSNRFGRASGWGNNAYFSAAELAKMDSLNYDWLANDWERGSAMQHSLTVSGGSDRATYFAGGSYYTQSPNLGSQDYNRFSFRAGTDVKVVNNVKFVATIAATNTNLEKSFTKINFSDGYAVGGEQNDYSVLLHMPKYIPWVYNINGVDQWVAPALSANRVGSASGNNSLSNWNYYALQNNGSTTTNKSFNYNANFSLQYDVPFIKGLSLKGSYGLSNNSSNTEQIQMPLWLSLAKNTNVADKHLYTSGASSEWNAPVLNKSNSRVTYDNTTGSNYQMNFFATYDRSFGDHNVSAMVSAEQTKNASEDRYQIYDNPIPGAYNGTSISAGTLNASNTITYRQESGSQSYLGRVNYDYQGKYMAQFILRSDASTNFAPEHYWGLFPGISAGWVISKENFFSDVKWIDYLKLRASIAKTGNNSVKSWKWMQLYSAATDKGQGFGTTNGGNFTTGLTPEVSPNRDITWEQNLQRNIGLDMGFLKNRLTVTVDGYYNSLSDILTVMSGAMNVPISIGGAFAEQNYAALNYWGAEFSANWNDHIGQVNYGIGMNFSLSDNKVTKYFDIPFNYPSTISRQQGYSTIQPVWGLQTWKQTSTGDGILRTDADIDNYWNYLTGLATKAGTTPAYFDNTSKSFLKKGMLAYEDVAGDLDPTNQAIKGQNGRIKDNEDYVKLAKKNQSYSINTNLNVSWKSLSLMAQLATSWGGLTTVDRIKQATSSTAAMWAAPIYLNDMYDSTDNPNGKYPNIAYFDQAYKTSDFWTISSFRMYVRSMSLSYSLPKEFARKAHMENARLIVSGYNLWDFFNPYPNKYRNMYDNPKVGYPTLRTWSLGINVGF
ncbi:MAG TPA: SusC/RagA family TonB-linked outer membrane protein [Phnomibacter sp.]|nr:SusC/RagA family TonB-linked outer membrane protein [Phnomibacter sp.]